MVSGRGIYPIILVLELGVALVDGGLVAVGVVDAVHEVATAVAEEQGGASHDEHDGQHQAVPCMSTP